MGSEIGKLLKDPDSWGKRLAGHAQKGRVIGIECGKMCTDCAFKYNQPHTDEYLESVGNAAKTILFGGEFHCHTTDKEGNYIDAGKPCAGFLYAKAYLETLD